LDPNGFRLAIGPLDLVFSYSQWIIRTSNAHQVGYVM